MELTSLQKMNEVDQRARYFGHGLQQMFRYSHFHMALSFLDLEYLFGRQRLQQ